MLLPLLMTTIAGLSTGLGGLLRRCSGHAKAVAFCGRLCRAVMLTVSLADLAPALLDFYGALLSPFGCGAAAAALLLGGMLAAWLLACALPDEDTLADRFGSRTQGSAMRAALVTGAALLLHNLPEGILTLLTNVSDPQLGARTALAIALHNIPEGLGCCGAFCLRHRQPGQGCRGCAGIRPCGTGGGRFGGTGAGPTVDAGTFERHCGCGGGYYAVGGGCPAAARGV